MELKIFSYFYVSTYVQPIRTWNVIFKRRPPQSLSFFFWRGLDPVVASGFKGPHLLARNAVGGAAKACVKLWEWQECCRIRKEGEVSSSPALFGLLWLVLRIHRTATDSRTSADSSAIMSEDLSSQPWSINRDDYELHEVIGMSSLAC